MAKHLDENIKIPAFTNLSFTGVSHFAGIPKSSIATLPHLHWQQSTLVKIPKIWHSQTHHAQWQVTLPELPNPALSNLAITLVAKHIGENIKNPAFTNPSKSLCQNS